MHSKIKCNDPESLSLLILPKAMTEILPVTLCDFYASPKAQMLNLEHNFILLEN